jgi:hypothetical protein
MVILFFIETDSRSTTRKINCKHTKPERTTHNISLRLVYWNCCLENGYRTRNDVVSFSPLNYSNFYGLTKVAHLVHAMSSSFWLNYSMKHASVSDTWRTSVPKKLFFSLFLLSLDTYQTYLQELKMCWNNNVDQ